MTDAQIADFLLTLISDPAMKVPGNEVESIYQCRQWLKKFIEETDDGKFRLPASAIKV